MSLLRFSVKIVCVFLIAICAFSSSVSAQIAVIKGWDVDPALEEKKAAVFSALKSGNGATDDAFFEKFYFARWTRPENIGLVQGFAKDFLTDLASANGNGRDTLLTKSFNILKKIVADGAAPQQARYNAILTIGQLSQKEPAGRGQPPTPYSPALPYLIAEYKKAENPRYIQVGALLGVYRFACIGIADENTKNTTSAFFVEILQSGQPKAGVNKDEQEELDWFRFYVLDGLGALKSIGANGSVVNALSEIIENDRENIEIRTRAARTLGDLNFEEAGSINFQKLGTQLITLMKTTSDSQLQMVTQLRDKARVTKGTGSNLSSGMMSGDSMSGRGMSGSSSLLTTGPTEIEPEFFMLTPTQQLEVTGAVQNVKMNVLNVLYGMRGPRLSGNTTVGVLPKLPNDDPVAAKLNATSKSLVAMFKILDEGLPEDEKKRSLSSMSSMSSSSSDMDSYSGSGGSGTKPKPKDEKQLKVNFTAIQTALQTFSDEIAKIIAGK